MDTVELTNTAAPTANSSGFFEFLRRFLTGLFGADTSSSVSARELAVESEEKSENPDRFVLAPCGYAIRVPQASDFNHSVSEMLPSVRQGLNQLPPLPSVALELLREIQDPNSTAASVAAVASSDPALAAALIRTVNGAAMGLARKITSAADAVNYLGFATVKAMVVRLRLETVLSPKSGQDAADAEDLWIHSLAVSYVAENLARRVADVDAGFVATLGLLHDIGKLAILAQMPKEAEKLRVPLPPGESTPIRTREAELLGVDHAGLGATLALNWRLPADLIQAIRWHHRPANAFLPSDPLPLRKALHLVQIANQIAKYCFPYCDHVEIDWVSDDTFQALGFEASLQKLLDAPVQAAITRAIFFAEVNSRRPSTAPRRFLRPLSRESAKRLLAEPASNASQIKQDDASIDEFFGSGVPEFRYSADGSGPAALAACGVAKARFTVAATTEGVKSALLAIRTCLNEMDLPAEARSTATLTIGSLLPNVLAMSRADETIEVAYTVGDRRVDLAIRAPGFATSRRLETPATPDMTRRLAEADFAGILNLCWFDRIAVTGDGSASAFWSR